MRYEEHKVCFDAHDDTITCIAFNADGKLLASASLDGNLHIWGVDSGELQHSYFSGHGVLSLVWVDSSTVLCGLSNGTISSLAINFEKKTLDVTGAWGHSYPVEALAVVKSCLVSGAHKELFIWQWNYNALLSYQERDLSWSPPSNPNPQGAEPQEVLITGVDWSGNNGTGHPSLLVVSYMYHGIRIIETQRWTEVRKINTQGMVGAASVSPDGAHLAVSNLRTGFDVYGLDSGELVSSFHRDVAEACPIPVLWLHGGRAILGGTTTGSIRGWYLKSRHRHFSLATRGRKVLAVSAYYNDITDEFFITCGSQSDSPKSAITIWRAGHRKDDGPAAFSYDDEETKSSHGVEAQVGCSDDDLASWNWCTGISVVVVGIVAFVFALANISPIRDYSYGSGL